VNQNVIYGPQLESSNKHLTRATVKSSYAQVGNGINFSHKMAPIRSAKDLYGPVAHKDEHLEKRTHFIKKVLLKREAEEQAYKTRIGSILSSQDQSRRDIKVNVDALIPLLNIKYDEELEKMAQLALTKKMEDTQRKKNEESSIKRLYSANPDFRLNRIVPYVNFSEKCVEKVKQFRYSTKSQKNLYQFNRMIIEEGQSIPVPGSIQRMRSAHVFQKS